MSEVASHYENHKFSLAAEVVRSGFPLRLQALGTSMLPTLWPGDVLTIQSQGREIRDADIVLAERENSFLVHRVVSRVGPVWITRGDAMPCNDQPISPENILGRVSLVERGNRLIVPDRKLSQLRRLLARVLCHSDLVRRLALRVHAIRVKPSTKAAGLACGRSA